MHKTIIKLTIESPYKVIAEYDFIYNPLPGVKLVIGERKYLLQDMSETINEKGDITRIFYFK